MYFAKQKVPPFWSLFTGTLLSRCQSLSDWQHSQTFLSSSSLFCFLLQGHVRKSERRARVWVKSEPIISAAGSFSSHSYIISSYIYKESSGPCYRRKPQIGGATEMCNLVGFVYSKCHSTRGVSLQFMHHTLLLLLQLMMLSTLNFSASRPQTGESILLLSNFWHGHRCVPTLTA